MSSHALCSVSGYLVRTVRSYPVGIKVLPLKVNKKPRHYIHINFVWFLSLDETACNEHTCSGNGKCEELAGGSTLCICSPGYTSQNCSESKWNQTSVI